MNSESNLCVYAWKLLEKRLELILVFVIRHYLKTLRPRVDFVVNYEYNFSLHRFFVDFLDLTEYGCQYLNFTLCDILNSSRLCSILCKKWKNFLKTFIFLASSFLEFYHLKLLSHFFLWSQSLRFLDSLNIWGPWHLNLK